ncbi:MAG: PIG-L deacetylase family protein [Steroidobacteraceae bacterium]
MHEVLFLGAHCDDVEIGCGGTLAALGRQHPGVRVNIAVFSGDATRTAETRAAMGRLLAGATDCHLEFHDFRDGHFPAQWSAIKQRIELLKEHCAPDIIFTHHEHDRHQDHRTICELTWNTFRNHAILEYEIPKYDGDFGHPGLFVPLTTDIVQLKIDTLMECFASQVEKRWFADDLFRSVMRLRGMECNVESGYAEAFHARKVTVRW